MRYAAWIGANLAASWAAPLAGFGLSALGPPEWGSMLITYPGSGLIVGLIQWAVLSRWFMLRAWWWIPATGLGLVACVLFSWFFLLAPGLTSGLAQYALVKRRWPKLAELWVVAAGTGWAAGLIIASLFVVAGSPWGMMAAVSVSATLYGSATAVVIALLERLNPTERAPLTATGKVGQKLAALVSLLACAAGAWTCFTMLAR